MPMYPFVRLAWQVRRHRNDPPIGLTDVHTSQHICWPWDLDIWRELNNGRTLTLFDMGRISGGRRSGFFQALSQGGWGLAVAGASVRYRKRIKAFDRITMLSRGVGWDERFIYMEQSMWVRGQPACHVLIRSAITSDAGIVAPARLIALMGRDVTSPPLPDWVMAWIAADAQRPWPPMAAPGG
jgi:acyl-CoA thioesterase FadM